MAIGTQLQGGREDPVLGSEKGLNIDVLPSHSKLIFIKREVGRGWRELVKQDGVCEHRSRGTLAPSIRLSWEGAQLGAQDTAPIGPTPVSLYGDHPFSWRHRCSASLTLCFLLEIPVIFLRDDHRALCQYHRNTCYVVLLCSELPREAR